jgi:hypothetical protein
MTPDRIDYDKLTALVNARTDPGTRRALRRALDGVNDAEQTMRSQIAALRSALNDAEARLADARMRADARHIQRAAADLGIASTALDTHWATAAALLTEDEMRDLAARPRSALPASHAGATARAA